MDTTNTTLIAGTLTLTVWPDAPLGEHQRYAYRITDTTSGQVVEGRDLFTGASPPVAPDQALRDLAGFLSAAGEARQHVLDHPGTVPENGGLFPDWVADAARDNANVLAEIADGGGQSSEREIPDDGPRRWITVVFLQGAEADDLLALIDREGTDAAISYLAGYDFGEETVQAAFGNGYVYEDLPTGTVDEVAVRDVYTLSYNHHLGHVSLLREFDALPDPALLGIDTPTTAPVPAPDATPKREPGGAAVEPDWFANPSGPGTSVGRGLSL